MNTKDEAVINAFLKTSRICGIFPSGEPSSLLYAYQVLICVLTLLYGVFSIYKFIFNNSVDEHSMDIFINTLTTFICITLGFSMQFISLWQPEGWRGLYKNLKIGCYKTKSRDKCISLELLAAKHFLLCKIFFNYICVVLVVGILGCLRQPFYVAY